MLAGLASKFLPMLAGAAKTILPGLAIGSLSGLAQEGVKAAVGKSIDIKLKDVIGNGLYLKRGGCACKLEYKNGQSLITPIVGKTFRDDGIYKQTPQGDFIKHGKGFADVIGNIPLLGPILSPIIKLFGG